MAVMCSPSGKMKYFFIIVKQKLCCTYNQFWTQNKIFDCYDVLGTRITKLTFGDCVSSWSKWVNKDDPAGKEDNEILNSQSYCTKADAVQARRVGTTELETTQIVRINKHGFKCVNNEQPNGKQCHDYEIRVCCPGTYASSDLYNLTRKVCRNILNFTEI